MKFFKQTWKAFVLLLFFAFLLNSGCTYDYQGGPGNLEPIPDGIGFEVKFLLDPEKSIDFETGNLNQFVIDLFENALPWTADVSMGVNRDVIQQLVDTPRHDLWSQGWLNRLRHHVAGGSQPGDLQATFRKRLSVYSGTHVPETAIQAALAQAKKDGTFDWAANFAGNRKGTGPINLEIDWSYDSCTLTISRTIDGIPWNALGLPRYNDSIEASRAFLLNEGNQYWSKGTGNNFKLDPNFTMEGFWEDMDKLNLTFPRYNVSDWYKDKIENGVLYGPAFIRRYRLTGSISPANSLKYFGVEKTQELTFDIEVMPFLGNYIVELSYSETIDSTRFAANGDVISFKHLARIRQFMHDLLYDAGLLVPQSGLKNTLILENLRQDNPKKGEEPDSKF